MNCNEEYLKYLSQTMPEKCSPRDLVKFGIYNNPQCACIARKRGDTPDYFKVGKRIIYMRDAVIQWLKTRSYEINQKKIHGIYYYLTAEGRSSQRIPSHPTQYRNYL